MGLHTYYLFLNMQREKRMTEDGSYTLFEPQLKVTYHSIHGAIRESRHVFLGSGLDYWIEKNGATRTLNVLEMGFGTGLNALLTLIAATEKKLPVHYHALEPFPLDEEEWSALNYIDLLHRPECQTAFLKMHREESESGIALNPDFMLYRYKIPVQEFQSPEAFDLVYYDAFAPDVQPELWTTELFQKIYAMMADGGVLVTYCAKGAVRRSLSSIGFKVERIPGPPGKREMLRAVK